MTGSRTPRSARSGCDSCRATRSESWITTSRSSRALPSMRVVPNGDGSELVFTLIRQSGMSDGQFVTDKAAVENDLKALKTLLERKSSS